MVEKDLNFNLANELVLQYFIETFLLNLLEGAHEPAHLMPD